MNICKKLLDLLYPHVCPFCQQVTGAEICGACRRKIEFIKEPRCKCCGKPVRYEEQELCSDCREKEHLFESGYNLWLHKMPVSGSLYQFKYHNKRIFGEYYAQELVKCYGDIIRKWEIQMIIPIPLHRQRYRKRGYNQAETVARHIGRKLGILTAPKALKRVKKTNPQKQLDDRSRRKNVKGAFRAYGNFKGIYNILLVDDIYTTGSTLDEAAKTLKDKGVRNIRFLTISIGQGF